MKIFETALKVKGYPLDEAKKQLILRQSLEQENFEKDTEKLRNEIFEFHSRYNKYYYEFLGKRKINDWKDIPVMNKRSMQVELSKRLSNGYSFKNVYINNTSGSTGQPFYFAKDKFAHSMTWALILERYWRHGIDINKSLQARFYGIPLNSSGYLKERIKDQISNRYRFPVFDLSDQKIKNYLSLFYKKRFEYINGYTSSLVLFAKYLIKNRIILKEICPTLKICITTSEVCDQFDRDIMEKAFGVKLINEYGAAELDILAFEDEDGNWIMSDENLYFEVVDHENNILPQNTEGKLLVTSLYNKAMPFIRYELGDFVRISSSKKGNNSILESLIGRTNDIIVLPSGKKAAGLTFYYVSKRLIEEGCLLKEFVVKQTSSDQFVIEYISDNELSEDYKTLIKKTIDTYLEPGLNIYFRKVEHLERDPSGKLKHFQRLF